MQDGGGKGAGGGDSDGAGDAEGADSGDAEGADSGGAEGGGGDDPSDPSRLAGPAGATLRSIRGEG